MKINLIHILLIALIIWNVVLSLPKKQGEEINYELFQEFYKQSERRYKEFELQMTKLSDQNEKDSIFIYNASKHERDSIRNRYNPR